jgi:hypothetical protein
VGDPENIEKVAGVAMFFTTICLLNPGTKYFSAILIKKSAHLSFSELYLLESFFLHSGQLFIAKGVHLIVIVFFAPVVNDGQITAAWKQSSEKELSPARKPSKSFSEVPSPVDTTFYG